MEDSRREAVVRWFPLLAFVCIGALMALPSCATAPGTSEEGSKGGAGVSEDGGEPSIRPRDAESDKAGEGRRKPGGVPEAEPLEERRPGWEFDTRGSLERPGATT